MSFDKFFYYFYIIKCYLFLQDVEIKEFRRIHEDKRELAQNIDEYITLEIVRIPDQNINIKLVHTLLIYLLIYF